MSDLPILPFASLAAFEEWLEAEHAVSPGLWLKFAKKGSGVASITYPEARDAALCFGWIDGQKASLDETYWLLRFTPRTPRSKWSQINRERVAELTAEGRMRPAGLAEVERAKADGRWERAYASPSNATIPEDLQDALDAAPAAAEAFAGLDGRNRYAILYRIQDAKRPQTRAARIEKFVEMLRKGEKPHP
ncbi:YdeI/OmpD-associated family protein [Actinocorallia populi]|uniref:YdeI/OmpD-associated family protein n=1 Tax=Actinocorallia populi TaxID=2079200 RepID=UPI0018E5489A|nr:YdeI/OmpD-associated family protein [Actinocorallia populi]